MKIIDEKIAPCATCNPDGTDDPNRETWCDNCRGVGFVWLRTVQLNKPINVIAIEIDLTF